MLIINTSADVGSLPCNATEPVHFRYRIGEKGIELIFWESIRINNDDPSGKSDETAFIDSAVQEKNITYPTDSKLHRKIIDIFGKSHIEMFRHPFGKLKTAAAVLNLRGKTFLH